MAKNTYKHLRIYHMHNDISKSTLQVYMKFDTAYFDELQLWCEMNV